MLRPGNVQDAPKTPLVKGINSLLYGFGYGPRLCSIQKYRKYIRVVEPTFGTQWDHGPPTVPVQHLHTVAGDGNASINFMLASTWAVNLGTKIRKGIYNLHIASTNLDCSTVTSVVWILVFAQLMGSPRGCASSFITCRARTSTDSICQQHLTKNV